MNVQDFKKRHNMAPAAYDKKPSPVNKHLHPIDTSVRREIKNSFLILFLFLAACWGIFLLL